MGRRYYISLAPTAVTVAADLVEITPADDKPIKILAINLHQTTEIGDAMSEVLSIVVTRGNTTSGSGGGTFTPVPCNPADAAAGCTVETFNTTAASAGTAVNGPRHGMQVLAGMERPYTPDEVFQATQGQTLLIIRMAEAPDDSVTIGGSVLIEEGG